MLREVTFPAATSLLNLVQGFGIIYNDLFIILSKERTTWFQNDFNLQYIQTSSPLKKLDCTSKNLINLSMKFNILRGKVNILSIRILASQQT